MMISRRVLAVAAMFLAASAFAAEAQRGGGRGAGAAAQRQGLPDTTRPHVRQTPPADPVIQRMWQEGMERSQVATLAQVLLDSIGPRLTGSPGMERASEWVRSMYTRWGIPARAEQYGTWNSWERGITHVDLLFPRVRSLEAMMLAWSPGTDGRPVEGEVLLMPDVTDSIGFKAWLPQARGNFVLTAAPRLSCRSPSQWATFATPESEARLQAEQSALASMYAQRMQAVNRGSGPADPAAGGRGGRGGAGGAPGARPPSLQERLQQAGVAGVLSSNWSQYPGINKIFGSPSQRVPTIDVSCEDYGLLFRMAQANQKPRIRLTAESRFLGERPVFNTIGEIKGSEKPDEYIVLSAHFDSWDGSSGATDNGTGTLTMMEAMRILKATYPNPKRTIIAGHWSGEEQGLNGSRAFTEDHPEVVRGLQALFNQDNGTGRVSNVSPPPLIGTRTVMEHYLMSLPREITQYVGLGQSGTTPASGGSDHASFQCHGAPAFSLGALSWDYSNTTWHTNRDTYDKVVLDDLRHNATLTAMLAYMASEDPNVMPRERPLDAATGQPAVWNCSRATRRSADSNR